MARQAETRVEHGLRNGCAPASLPGLSALVSTGPPKGLGRSCMSPDRAEPGAPSMQLLIRRGVGGSLAPGLASGSYLRRTGQ